MIQRHIGIQDDFKGFVAKKGDFLINAFWTEKVQIVPPSIGFKNCNRV